MDSSHSTFFFFRFFPKIFIRFRVGEKRILAVKVDDWRREGFEMGTISIKGLALSNYIIGIIVNISMARK